MPPVRIKLVNTGRCNAAMKVRRCWLFDVVDVGFVSREMTVCRQWHQTNIPGKRQDADLSEINPHTPSPHRLSPATSGAGKWHAGGWQGRKLDTNRYSCNLEP
jgi:hypothetical protein